MVGIFSSCFSFARHNNSNKMELFEPLVMVGDIVVMFSVDASLLLVCVCSLRRR